MAKRKPSIKFNGKPYDRYTCAGFNKKSAKKWAQSLREKGNFVRVKQEKNRFDQTIYVLYVRKK